MGPLAIGLIAGAGLGLLKNRVAAQQAADERKRQAAIARYSPWTGLTPSSVQDPNLFGDLVSGTAAGGMMGQAYGSMPAASAGSAGAASGAASNQALASKMSLLGKEAASPYSLMGGSAAAGMDPIASKMSLGLQNPYMDMDQKMKMFSQA